MPSRTLSCYSFLPQRNVSTEKHDHKSDERLLGGTPLIPTPWALDSLLTAKHRYVEPVKLLLCHDFVIFCHRWGVPMDRLSGLR